MIAEPLSAPSPPSPNPLLVALGEPPYSHIVPRSVHSTPEHNRQILNILCSADASLVPWEGAVAHPSQDWWGGSGRQVRRLRDEHYRRSAGQEVLLLNWPQEHDLAPAATEWLNCFARPSFEFWTPCREGSVWELGDLTLKAAGKNPYWLELRWVEGAHPPDWVAEVRGLMARWESLTASRRQVGTALLCWLSRRTKSAPEVAAYAQGALIEMAARAAQG
jgi:hypothetical protein